MAAERNARPVAFSHMRGRENSSGDWMNGGRNRERKKTANSFPPKQVCFSGSQRLSAPSVTSLHSDRSSWEREERGASSGQARRREMEVARRERDEREGR